MDIVKSAILSGPDGNRRTLALGADAQHVDIPAELAERFGLSGEVGLDTLLERLSGSMRGLQMRFTLASGSWVEGVQAVQDDRLLPADRYAYLVMPDSASVLAYSAAMVYAENVTDDGLLLFRAAETPEEDLLVNVLRMEVPENG